MTIEKGQTWGGPAPDPEPGLVARSDAELAALAFEVVNSDSSGAILVTGGDLLATLGVDGLRPPAERHAYPIDLGLAYLRPTADDKEQGPRPFIAHVTVGPTAPSSLAGLVAPVIEVLGRALGHGPAITVAAMNAAWLGDLRLGPRAHPNDGLLDITEGRVGFQQRREAARRARSGSHIPHPALKTTRTASWDCQFERPRLVRLDGDEVGRFLAIRVELQADACIVVA